MKKFSASIILMLLVLSAGAQVLVDDSSERQNQTYTKGLKFNEGTVSYRNQLLVSNFGGETLDPLNLNGKGYIVSVSDGGTIKTFIPADGNLSAPKGMCISKGYLFIADVGKVVIYNLRNLSAAPTVVQFPEEDLFVNDIVELGNMVLVSVTNTGRIYCIDNTNPEREDRLIPQVIGNVPGANGMVVNDNMIYIASYNPSGVSESENVIYAYDAFKPDGGITKLIPDLSPGQYDGIAVTDDGATLIFSSWGDGKATKAGLYAWNLDGKSKVRFLDFGIEFAGPADISIHNGSLWIPDLPNSKLYQIPLE